MCTDLGEMDLAVLLFIEQSLVLAHSDNISLLRNIISLDRSIDFKELLLAKIDEVVRSLDDVSVGDKGARNVHQFVDDFKLVGLFDNLLINFALIFGVLCVVFEVFLPVVFELNNILDGDSINSNMRSEHVVLRVLLLSREDLHFRLIDLLHPVHVKVFKHVEKFLLVVSWLSNWCESDLGFLVGHWHCIIGHNLVLSRSHEPIFKALLIFDDVQNAENQ